MRYASKAISHLHQKERKMDFQKALTYPLAEVPLTLCNADGSMRKTNKSNLDKKVLSRLTDETTPIFEKGNTAVIVDFMGLVRTITHVPDTFEDLAMKIISFLPIGFKRIDLVADSYRQNSIKDAERANRGQSSRIILKSALSKIPREFSKFLSNGENKPRMIELIFETLQRKKAAVLNTLRTTKIILSREIIAKAFHFLQMIRLEIC